MIPGATPWYFSSINYILLFRVAMRQQGDLIRTMYPKLMLEGSATFGGHSTMGGGGGSTLPQGQPLSSSVAALKRPPLARAVHLTLGEQLH